MEPFWSLLKYAFRTVGGGGGGGGNLEDLLPSVATGILHLFIFLSLKQPTAKSKMEMEVHLKLDPRASKSHFHVHFNAVPLRLVESMNI